MKNLKVLTPLCFCCLLVFTCALDGAEQEQNVVAGIDPATEVRLGTLWRDQDIKGFQLSTNQVYIEAVNRVGRRIVSAISERPDLADDWEFTVIDSPIFNAFATGGGKVVVYEGFLDVISKNNGGKPDEDMLAHVLGHEMTHNVRRHILQGASITGSVEWIIAHLDAIEKDTQGTLSPEEIARLEELARARFTRVQEFEADLLGALYATRAGFDGFNGALGWMHLAESDRGGAYSMSEYIPKEKATGGTTTAFDHPTYPERIAKLESYKETISNFAGEFNWGDYLLKTYNFEKAAQCFKDVTKVFPNSFEAWNNLGIAYHWQYLQTAGKFEKFQPGLVDYFVQIRDRVRGESPLNRAIRAYQEALKINPKAFGTQSNLAIALIETHDAENLATAEGILQKLLKTDPDNPIYINDLAILTYWKTQGSSETAVKQDEAEGLFAKAAALDYLPAKYNLAVLQLETGKENDGAVGLQAYLKQDAFSPWAKLAVEFIKKQDPDFKDPPAPISTAGVNVLNVRCGSTSDDVIKAVGQPERTEKPVTSEEEEGLIFHYDKSLGINVVFSSGKVIMVNVFAPQVRDAAAGTLAPEVAGVEIGASVEDLKNKIGQPVQVRPVPNSKETEYFYSTADSIIDFTVTQFGKVRVICLLRRA